MGNHRTIGSGRNEWYTPKEYIEAARFVMGSIDLDPASNAEANLVVQATSFFTVQDNGLTKEWFGNIWMNPPYGQPGVSYFVDKLLDELESGHITQAVMLTHNVTETKYFQSALGECAAVCFPSKRIRFYPPSWDGTKATLAIPTNGQAFMYFGAQRTRFCDAFGNYGVCLARIGV